PAAPAPRASLPARLQLGQGTQGGAQRGSHAGAPLPVVDGAGLVVRAQVAQVDLGGPGNDEDRVRAAGPEHGDAALGEGSAVQFDERLRPAEPGSLPGGEQHSRDCTAHDPPQGLAGELVVDPALGGGQRVAGAAPAELDQLGGYRYRGLLRRPGPEIKPDRGAYPGEFVLGQADLAQPGQPVVVRTPAAHRADV